MTVYPRAKLNWTLNVLSERADGYHELDMLMQPVTLCDELSVEPLDDGCASMLEITSDTGDIISAGPDNLVLRAERALREIKPDASYVRMRLKKRIPAQAGMGGGSADAAYALRALNELWGLGLANEGLCAIGMGIGSDVPFCVCDAFARVQGRGESVRPLDGAPRVSLIIIMPCAGLSTRDVFNACRAGVAQPTDEAVLRLAAGDWDWLAANTANDLEPPARALRPEIGRCIDDMYRSGARFARMTGSGAAVYGVFDAARRAGAYAELNTRWPRIYRAETYAQD